MRFGTPLEMIDTNLQYLDSSHTDLEFKEIWNGIYDKWGCRIPQLEGRWYRDNGVKDFDKNKTTTKKEVVFPFPKTTYHLYSSIRSILSSITPMSSSNPTPL
jgi:hypothetical protein